MTQFIGLCRVIIFSLRDRVFSVMLEVILSQRGDAMDFQHHILDIPFDIGSVTFRLLSITYAPFVSPIPEHSHGDSCYELHYIPEGYGYVHINQERYELTPNTFYITGPHIQHAQFPYPDQPMKESCLYLNVSIAKDQSVPPEILSVLNGFIHTPFWLGSCSREVTHCINQLFSELTTQHVGYILTLQTLLIQLIISCVRLYKPTNKSAGTLAIFRFPFVIGRFNPKTISFSFKTKSLYSSKYVWGKYLRLLLSIIPY